MCKVCKVCRYTPGNLHPMVPANLLSLLICGHVATRIMHIKMHSNMPFPDKLEIILSGGPKPLMSNLFRPMTLDLLVHARTKILATHKQLRSQCDYSFHSTSDCWKGKGEYLINSVSGCMRGVQVKLWDPLRTRAVPERLRAVIKALYKSTFTLPYLTVRRFRPPLNLLLKAGINQI